MILIVKKAIAYRTFDKFRHTPIVELPSWVILMFTRERVYSS